ncbi:thioesterase [Caballeronia temeraria]|uniref:Thioesterase n=1 Tax=Caballeronia temeraria TaxID=1777137 RepID=A0A158A3X5_9BURK|nr:thioesterase family protein [Caballeronia temeraria]SAK52531.1 thioesterase [Caballeronia temeraria]
MTRTFDMPMRVRFAHCDPAGIVYFPQYLVMTNMLVEDWFDNALGIGYARMISQRRVGLPIVKLNCDFSRPSRMGERVTLSLAVDSVGQRSIRIDIVCHCDGEVRFRAKQVLVTTSLDDGKSIDIPGDIAHAIEQFAPGTSRTLQEETRS